MTDTKLKAAHSAPTEAADILRPHEFRSTSRSKRGGIRLIWDQFRFQVLDEVEHYGRDWQDTLGELLRAD